MKKILLGITILLFALFCASISKAQTTQNAEPKSEKEIISNILHSVNESDLRTWTEYLVSDECRGRLTGDVGFDRAAVYTAGLFKEWGLEPAGDNGTYLQSFAHPYTEVRAEGNSLMLYYPVGKDWIAKTYDFPYGYVPGASSDSISLKGVELVYVGFGITASDLNFDEYKGIDVKGKVVVCESGMPYTGRDIEEQRKWNPYQRTAYKVANAKGHGAAGFLLVSTTATVSAGWHKDLYFAQIGEHVADDLFAGTGKKYADVKKYITTNFKPQSVVLNKKADLSANTKHHPDGKGYNVVGIIRGTDPTLKAETIAIGAHPDHLGMLPVIFQGALDNASGSAVTLGAAKALATSGFKPKRTLVFILFGAEEAGLLGAKHFVANPCVPKSSIKVMINTDMLGTGYGLGARVARMYGSLLSYIEQINDTYIKRQFNGMLSGNEVLNPRTDGGVFFQNNIPTIEMRSFGHTGFRPYHDHNDRIDILKFDIMRDASAFIAACVMSLANEPKIEVTGVEE